MTPTPDDLEAAERRLQQAMIDSDVAELDALLDDDVVYTSPDGSTVDKTSDLEAHRSGLLDVRHFDTVSLATRVIASTGVTFVEADLRGDASGQPFSARMRYTRTWVNTHGAWRVIAAHASTID